MSRHSMTHLGGGRLRALALLAASLLVWSGLATMATAASFKPYQLINVPKVLATSGAVNVTVKNDAGTQQLGSIVIGVPSPITIAPATGSGGTSLSPTLVQFQNLNLANNQSKVLSFTVTTPCSAGSFTWNFQAQQANQWQSGNGANYLTLAKVTYDDSTGYGTLTSKVAQPKSDYANNCVYDLNGIPDPGVLTGGANAVSIGVVSASVGRTLSSVTVGVSAGYSISSLSGSGSSVTFVVNLAPGGSTNLAFTVNAPCAGDLTWSFTPSPTFVLRNLNGDLYAGGPIVSTLASPACTLKFLTPAGSTKQVADAQKATILSAGAPGAGAPVRVGLYDGTGTNPIATAGVNISVALTGGPLSATLGGIASQATDASGVASFSDLSVNTSAPNYRLRASSAVTPDKDSDPFNVVDSIQPCTSSSCTIAPLTDASNNSYLTQPKQNGTAGSYVSASLNPLGLVISCSGTAYGDYADNATGTVWFNYNGAGAKVNTLRIDKAIVQQDSNNGRSFYQICYASPTQFTARGGQPAAVDTTTNGPSAYFGTTWYMGLLPDCPKNPGALAACVLKRNAEGSGNAIITFQTPSGDPGYR